MDRTEKTADKTENTAGSGLESGMERVAVAITKNDAASTSNRGPFDSFDPDTNQEEQDVDPDFTWLLTRQLEVEMSLRGDALASQGDVEKTRKTIHEFTLFFQTLNASAATLSNEYDSKQKNHSPPKGTARQKHGFLVPPVDSNQTPACAPSLLFQELLHRVAGFGVNSGQSVDEQSSQSNVPMHNSKVLYRQNVFDLEVLTRCDEVLGTESMQRLGASGTYCISQIPPPRLTTQD